MFGNSRRLLAAAVVPGAIAAVVLAGPGVAGASTGTTQISPEQAGYTATGAQFKTVDASVYLRNPGQYAGEVASFGHSVQLWSSDLVVTLGVTAPTTPYGHYTPYAIIYDRRTHTVIASNPNAQFCDADDNCSTSDNYFQTPDTLKLVIDYSLASGQLNMTASGETYAFTSDYAVSPQSFTQARIGTDFGSSPWTAPSSYTPPASYMKVAAYNDVALTTYSGHTSTLWSWWVHHPLLANTEQQSGSDWVAVPTNLFNSGASFRTWFVPQTAQGANQPVLP
jgi:hypothetical protein